MKDAQKKYFLEILEKYRKKKANSKEIKFLETYYDMFEENEDLINEENEGNYLHLKENIKTAIDKKISSPNTNGKEIKILWFKYAAVAAALLMVLFASLHFFNTNKENNLAEMDHHINPGGNNATLILSGGEKIVLNNASQGEIARQSGISITKTANGQIVYAITSKTSDKPLKNTIITPKGGQYKVILPDGTEVALNAASTLTYPTSFQGGERRVELKGEAYFEVTKNAAMPFRVQSTGQTVEVLGTHFNINAYDDESIIRTTLLEGSVKITSAIASSIISPGQQALISKTGKGTILTKEINPEKEIAWKDGMFSFENDDIKSVMRSISRWYNVNVSYKGNLPDIDFTGEIFRTAKLSEVFKILELNGIQFEVEGKNIIVSYNQEAVKTINPKNHKPTDY
ncbi:FecR family protein [Pedobacter sp.]|jgi:transmembrane sensor|uniref:FecR family protein n=1 Tax=Pedobacter sp. TaxID=1411316 RepID=UPI002D0B610D|nr:FecR domain-containing protein [Pedobacter sp.]HWW42978.1 FecR domain-containing protein [Pedobacter sp.]